MLDIHNHQKHLLRIKRKNNHSLEYFILGNISKAFNMHIEWDPQGLGRGRTPILCANWPLLRLEPSTSPPATEVAEPPTTKAPWVEDGRATNRQRRAPSF